MKKQNEVRLDSLLLGMAANTLSERLNNNLKGIDDENMINSIKSFDENILKPYKRKKENDGYAQVANTIGKYMDNDYFYNSKIRFLSLKDDIAHCVLINHQDSIMVDSFDYKRESYDIESGTIVYDNAKDFKGFKGVNELQFLTEYKADDESFDISVKDFLKIVEKIQPLIEIHKNRPEEKGKLVNMLNQGFDMDNALELTISDNGLSQNITQKRDNIHKNKI